MDFAEYFENTKGFGVFSTADRHGIINAAVYGRPHVLENGQFVFVMRNRLTMRNLRENPHAHFLFHEEGAGYEGLRLKLDLVRFEENEALYEQFSRSKREKRHPGEPSFVVYFRMTSNLPLIGT